MITFCNKHAVQSASLLRGAAKSLWGALFRHIMESLGALEKTPYTTNAFALLLIGRSPAQMRPIANEVLDYSRDTMARTIGSVRFHRFTDRSPVSEASASVNGDLFRR